VIVSCNALLDRVMLLPSTAFAEFAELLNCRLNG
jgi:hypothetical protein